ncbi:MAG: ABC transporter substrate-binding protein [Chloroflexota bacterium]|nr:ABC transporter substrate-binding protein [Chloroflexota bacterium]
MIEGRERRSGATLVGVPVSRRTVLGWARMGGAAVGLAALGTAARAPWVRTAVGQGTPAAGMVSELAIDLAAEPPSLDPAIVYDVDGWSVVHSVYDALVQYASDGSLEPLLAESLTLTDPLTYEVRLRQGVRFHNGEPFDARSVAFSVAHIQDPATQSQLRETFLVVERVEEVDPFTVRLRLARPAPWLPAQMAAWLAMLPPEYAADPANDSGANPVGTGPYRFAGWERGSRVELERNPDYFAGSPKGRAITERAAFRFVPDGGTRVADLLAGTAGLVRGVPVDEVEVVREGGAEVVAQPLSGSAWVRIATDAAPFDDVRVRRALNHAVDVDAIVAALVGGNGRRLANFFVEGRLGFDPELAPFPYDPDEARRLLAEVGYADGFETALEYSSDEREDVVAAIAGQLDEVGVRAEVRPVEKATFNATWADPATAALRLATWRPLFDPFTLLDLVVSERGFLSRHASPTAQPLIEAAAAEADATRRADTYRELGRVLREEPAAIYLYGLTALYGVAPETPAWTPRPDDYVIPTARG